ncbi:MAG: PIG-L family deacetylase [bacterium]|nr:PIG-L family deacetylase [bacterium]
MKNKKSIFLKILITVFCLTALNIYFIKIVNAFETKNIQFNSGDRILILAPHPDDEVLGCGGIIQKAKKQNIPVKVVFLTYGDNNEWSFMLYRKHPVLGPKAVQSMGLMRHDEAIEAAKILGVSTDEMIFLGYPDFRTLEIWYKHWGDSLPAESMFTRVNKVPYQNAFRPGTPYKADEILKDLKTIILDFKPTQIYLPHPSDHNPDHRSLYLFTRVALWDLEKEIKAVLYPYLIHFKKWPKSRGYCPDNQLIPPEFFTQKIIWFEPELDQKEVKAKHDAIMKHHTQFGYSSKYLLSFIRKNELFGDFPEIRLKQKEASPYAIEVKKENDLQEFPEELLDEEKALFVGIEGEYVRLEKDNLIFSLKLSKPMGEVIGVSLFAFGYREDIPFSKMPKLHIKFNSVGHEIYDQDKHLPIDIIEIKRGTREITISVPLKVMGDPDRILTSVHTSTLAVPLDWVSWKVIKIEK